jgi:3',5'-cyclic AMP phosphodiesterase CpdA
MMEGGANGRLAGQRALAHLSDLHIGRNRRSDERARLLCDLLVAAEVDHVVVTGDITHRGRAEELVTFEQIFAPLAARERLTVIPGNHDRLTDDVGPRLMRGGRVEIHTQPGLFLVRFDSTGPHNRVWSAGHGRMDRNDIALIGQALDFAPANAVVALLLHHHVLPTPGDDIIDRVMSWIGSPCPEELKLGRELLDAIRGRCDLVLHGHRHRPGTATFFAGDARPLAIYNAGSSTALGAMRVFQHVAGRLLGAPNLLVIAGAAASAAAMITANPRL